MEFPHIEVNKKYAESDAEIESEQEYVHHESRRDNRIINYFGAAETDNRKDGR